VKTIRDLIRFPSNPGAGRFGLNPDLRQPNAARDGPLPTEMFMDSCYMTLAMPRAAGTISRGCFEVIETECANRPVVMRRVR